MIFLILFSLNKINFYFKAVTVFAPVAETASSLINSIQNYWRGYLWLVDTEKENLVLLKKLNKMKGIKSSYDKLKMENNRLKALLSFKELNGIKCYGTSVIFRGASSKSNTIFLNRGTEDGVMKNMVVISPEGIVGKIVKISKSVSMAHLITHPNSAIDVLIQRTRERAVFQGGEPCRLKYLDDKADVKVGDILISSGLGGVFPAGLSVGKIVKVSKETSEVFLDAEAVPSADLKQLEDVLILENPYHLEIESLKKEINF